ncbi:MAG: hypothetical protein IKE64_07645, partial [Thermoguttaceae bacterium]|nr:hypothetical protein [Thermoguttaceae bacterium]
MPKKNSFAGLLASFRNRLGQSNSPRARSLHFEALEERHLLTVASVCAYDALAAEGSIADDGVFRVDIDEPCVDPITINYQLGGTTDTGGNTSSDYMIYSSSGTRLYPSRTYDASTGQYVYQGSITLAAGEQSATLLIRPVNDTLRESSETVALSLLAGTGYTVDSNADTASIVIADNDQWTVALETTDANASETSTDYGAFTLTRSGETDLSNPLRVYLTAGGTAGIGAYYYDIADCRLYTASGVQATWTSWTEDGASAQGYYVDIPANQTSLVLQVRPTDDMYREDAETVTLTLAPRSGYYTVDSVHNSGTVTIADNDQWTVSVTASDSQAAEGGTDYGLFTITRSGETDLNRSLTVKFSMTGTASYNSDYQLRNSSGGNISLSSSWDSTLGVYVYTGTVTIAYGAASTTVELRTVNNGTTESAETAQLNLLDNGYYAIDPEHAAAVVTILDNDDWTVSVTAVDSHAEEGGTDYGRWVISRSGSTDTAYAMTVKFRMLGCAQYNSSSYSSDYTLHTSTGSTINLTSAYDDTLEQYVYSGLIQIAGGQAETIVELRPANDATRETTETAVLELVEYGTPSYTIGTAQSEIQIIDNDQWTVNVQAETALSAESANPQAMTMRISRSGETDLTKPLTVYFRLGGTALYSTDYTLSGGSYFTSNNYGSVTIAAGQ